MTEQAVCKCGHPKFIHVAGNCEACGRAPDDWCDCVAFIPADPLAAKPPGPAAMEKAREITSYWYCRLRDSHALDDGGLKLAGAVALALDEFALLAADKQSLHTAEYERRAEAAERKLEAWERWWETMRQTFIVRGPTVLAVEAQLELLRALLANGTHDKGCGAWGNGGVTWREGDEKLCTCWLRRMDEEAGR